MDNARATLPGKDRRAERGTEIDVTGSYNQVFLSRKRTGARTSLIVDPPNGRIPPLTPEAQKAAAAERKFLLELLRATETCKSQRPQCEGAKYDSTPSPRRAELPPATMRREPVAGLNATIATMDRRMARCRIAA